MIRMKQYHIVMQEGSVFNEDQDCEWVMGPVLYSQAEHEIEFRNRVWSAANPPFSFAIVETLTPVEISLKVE